MTKQKHEPLFTTLETLFVGLFWSSCVWLVLTLVWHDSPIVSEPKPEPEPETETEIYYHPSEVA